MIIGFADPMTRSYALQVHPGSGNTCYLWNVSCATAEECSVVTPFRQSQQGCVALQKVEPEPDRIKAMRSNLSRQVSQKTAFHTATRGRDW